MPQKNIQQISAKLFLKEATKRVLGHGGTNLVVSCRDFLTKIFRIVSFETKRRLGGSIAKIRTPNGTVLKFCPNYLTYYRAHSLRTKEPETIAWIDTFQNGDCFYDVGASSGPYTLYASARPTLKVLSFEPNPFSYGAICRSVALNKFEDRILVFSFALNDITTLGTLAMEHPTAGWAGSQFLVDSKATAAVDVKAKFTLTSFAMDDFIDIFKPTFPNHIKIDIDGNDHLVLKGAKKTLKDERLRSVMIELSGAKQERHDAAILQLNEAGFKIVNESLRYRHNRLFRR